MLTADKYLLDLAIDTWERAERAHARSPSEATDKARKAAGAKVERIRKAAMRRVI